MLKKYVTVRHFTDENGTPVVGIQIINSTSEVVLDEDSFEELLSLGVPPRFVFNPWAHLFVSLRMPGVKQTISLPRLVMDAKEKENVRHINRDKYDCRRSNLAICKGAAKHRARSLITGMSSVYNYSEIELTHIYEPKAIRTSSEEEGYREGEKATVDLADQATSTDAHTIC